MTNLNKMLIYTLDITIFCIAISILFYNYRLAEHLLSNIKSIITDDDVIFADYVDADASYIERKELVTMLLAGIDYDVEIDGHIINTEDFNYATFDYSIIYYERYQREVTYDSSGNIMKIIYIGVTNEWRH